MKRLSVIILLIGLVGLFSCKKDETKTVINSSPGAPVLNLTSGAVIVLQKADTSKPIVYSWSSAEFGVSLVIQYELQMDKQGNNFGNPLSIGLVTNRDSLTVLTRDLDMKLLNLEFDPKHPDPLPMEFRVAVKVNDSVKTVYSNVVQQTITPFYIKIVYPILFVPGSYQGWNPADSTTTIASVRSDNNYEGYIWFPTDAVQYKYCQEPNWNTNWGDNNANGNLEPGGNNIIAGARGYYKLNVALSSLKHTFLRTEWSVIGDATPGAWTTDTDMTYDTIAKTWNITMDLTVGNIKFRANHDWALNYGDTQGNGHLDAGGSNIPVAAAGNYTITMNLSQPVYTYKLKKN